MSVVACLAPPTGTHPDPMHTLQHGLRGSLSLLPQHH